LSLTIPIIKNIFLLSSRQVFIIILNFISQILLMRHYDLGDYGIFILFFSIATIISSFAFPYYLSFQKFIPEYKKTNNFYNIKLLIEYSFSSAIKNISILWAITILLIFVYYLFVDKSFFYLSLISTLFIPLSFFKNYLTQFLISNENLKDLSIASLLNTISFLLFSLFISYTHLDLPYLFFIKIISELVFIYLGFFYLSKFYKISFKFSLTLTKHLSSIREYVLPLFKSNLVNIFYSEGSKVIVGSMISMESLSLYNLSRLVLDNITNIFYAIPSAIFPIIQRTYKQSKKIEFIVDIFYKCICFSFITLILIYLFGEKFIIFMFNEKYHYSYNLMIVLGIQILFRWPSNIFSLIININNNTNSFYKVSIYKFILDILTIYLFIFEFGIFGVVLSNVLGYIFASLYISYQSAKLIKINFLKIISVYLASFLFYLVIIQL
jgi:O-antigen/teichoic acid export membrane protein